MRASFDVKILLKQIFRYVWLIIAVFVLVVGGLYYRAQQNYVPYYKATCTMYVRSNENEKVSYSDISLAKTLIETYSVIMTSDRMMSEVARVLNEDNAALDESDPLHDVTYSAAYLRGTINVYSVNETEVMGISATTPDPELSSRICNAITEVAPGVLNEIIKNGTFSPIDGAGIPGSPVNRVSVNAYIKYGMAADVLIIGFIILLYALDTRIKSGEEIKNQYNIPVLGEIPQFGGSASAKSSRSHKKG